MNILYCGDRNAETGITLSLLSLLHTTDEPLHVFVFTLSYADSACSVLPFRASTASYLHAYLKQQNPQSTLRLTDMSREFEGSVPTANLRTRFTPCCMLRLFADMVPDIPDRILYLDYDTVVRGNITAFYRQDMEGVELAGVPDYYGRWFYSRPPFSGNYLNSGVLLMNMSEIRRSGLLSRCRALCQKRRMFLPDQHALNRCCRSRRIWSRDYNEQRRLAPSTIIQHFSTSFRLFPYPQKVSVKPWQKGAIHQKLGNYEYDDLLNELDIIKQDLGGM
ncbi:MAG: glycosyltransferase family 8 protein [Paludibacteraceae bacterium]